MATTIRLFFLVCIVFAFSNGLVGQESFAKAENVGNQEVTTEQAEIPVAQDLTSYLRRFSGLKVSGTKAYAKFKIRNSPCILFIVDGQRFFNGYRMIYHDIDVNDIKSVRIKKGVDQTFGYGSGVSGGVIEITTKDYFERISMND